MSLKKQLLERLTPPRSDKHSSLEGALTDFLGSLKPMTSLLTQAFKGATDDAATARVKDFLLLWGGVGGVFLL